MRTSTRTVRTMLLLLASIVKSNEYLSISIYWRLEPCWADLGSMVLDLSLLLGFMRSLAVAFRNVDFVLFVLSEFEGHRLTSIRKLTLIDGSDRPQLLAPLGTCLLKAEAASLAIPLIVVCVFEIKLKNVAFRSNLKMRKMNRCTGLPFVGFLPTCTYNFLWFSESPVMCVYVFVELSARQSEYDSFAFWKQSARSIKSFRPLASVRNMLRSSPYEQILKPEFGRLPACHKSIRTTLPQP